MNIHDFLSRIKAKDPSRIIPFIGSGIVTSLGYPDWGHLMEHAVSFVSEHNSELANFMKTRLSRGDYLGAGDLLYEQEIPEAERHNFFRKEFDKSPIISEAHLKTFLGSPFPAFITTNFDRTIEQAIILSHREPESFRDADRFRSFFSRLSVYSDDREKMSKGSLVLKLHGDVSDPRWILLGKQQLQALKSNESLGFIYKGLFTGYTIVFVGFSGNDPNFVWQAQEIKRVCGTPKGISYFIHPEGESAPFAMADVNIEEVTYSPSNNNEELRKSMCSMSGYFLVPDKQIPFDFPASPSDEAKQNLAFVTAGLREKAYQPSFECAAVSIVAEAAKSVGSLDDKDKIIEHISKVHNVGYDDASKIFESADEKAVSNALNSLEDSREKFQKMIAVLKDGIDQRSRAYGKPFVKTGSKSDIIIYNLFLGVFSRAGKALALSLLDSDPPDDSLIDRLIRKAIENLNSIGMGDLDKEVLLSVFADMFTRPTVEEGHAINFLAQATVAHALTVTFSGGLKRIKELLPERVYLDANIAIPIVIPDHPFSRQYRNLIRQLSRIDCNAYVLDVFLDEMMHHCKLAEVEINEAELKDVQEAKDYIDYHGLTSVNAFVTAYATGALGDESFPGYLKRWFGTANPKIDDFRAALSKMGIQQEVTKTLDTSSSKDLASYIMEEKKKLARSAVQILADHEATQLLWIHTQYRDKEVWFITQDAALRRILRRLNELPFSKHPPSKGVMPAYGASLLLCSISDQPDLDSSFSALLWNPTYLERVDTMLSNILRKFSDRTSELAKMDLVQLRAEASRVIQAESKRSERDAIHERALEYKEGKPKLVESILRKIGEIKK